MFKHLFSSCLQDINEWSNKTIFLIITMVSFFIRLPFFFRDYIDRDESTFILMGQSWLNGHLPYTELWDLKPPLVFLFFAGIIYLFGKSFFAIRMAGVLAVSITAYFTYAMGRQIQSKQMGFWAAITCVYLLSLFGSLQGLMSEHLCMLYFMPGVYLLLQKRNLFRTFAAGLLMGMALMTKINLAYAVILLGLFLFYEGFRKKKTGQGVSEMVLFGSGILVVILLTWLPYAVSNYSSLWWNSVVLAPLEYAGARRYSVLKLAPIVIFIGLFFYLSIKKKWLDIADSRVQLISITVIGIVLSFIKGGRVNGHYLIQFHPLFLVLLCLVVTRAIRFNPIKWRPWFLLLLLLLPVESYKEYLDVARYQMSRGTFFNGEGFSVPEYITEHHMDTKNILFLEYHIGYWMLQAKPPTPAATHPSNLVREELFKYYGNPRKTSMEELAYILDELRPEVVVTRHGDRIFAESIVAENEYVVNYLKKYYQVKAVVDRAEIHKRLK